MYRRRFLPRVYDRNFEIGNTLYTDAITDLNIRRGKAPFSSSNAITTTSLDRFNVFRDDMRLHDSVYARHASAEMVERMRVKRHFHQRMLRMYLLFDFPVRYSSYYEVLGTPFIPRIFPRIPFELQFPFAMSPIRITETRSRVRDFYDRWEEDRAEERKARQLRRLRAIGLPFSTTYFQRTIIPQRRHFVPKFPQSWFFQRPPAVF